MFEVKLKEGRRKGRFRGFQSLKQPLPVPISSLTELKASDSTWRFYHGKLEVDNAGANVLIEDKQEIDFVYEMGYFGTVYKSEKARKSKYRQKKKAVPTEGSPKPLVVLEEVSISLNDVSNKEDDDGGDVPDAQDESEDNDDLQIVEDVIDVEEKKSLVLAPYEAFFLAFGLGCLLVRDEQNQEMDIDALWSRFNEVNPDFAHQYAVYHHFRAKGYVVKEGTKFGGDFLLYKEGPPFYHALYCVKIMHKNENVTWQFISGLNRVTESTAKELILAQISESECCEQTSSSTQAEKSFAAKTSAESTSESEEAEKCPVKRRRISQNVHKLNHIKVEEMLIRRWVASKEREN